VKAVLAQINPSLGDLDRNLKLHLSAIDRAARAGADLIVFPELSLTGYMLQDLAVDCAQDPSSSPYLDRLARASRKIAVVAGFVEQAAGQAFYNAAACFLKGRLAHLHRKVYLPTYGMFDEARYLGAGDVLRTFDAPWGRTGLLICEDFWHLSCSYILSQEGMEYLIVVSNSPTKGLDDSEEPASRGSWLSLGKVTARFLSCFVLYVNRTGYEDGWNYSGGSYAVDPTGRVTAEAASFRATTVTATCRPATLRKARTAYPVLRDEKLDMVRRELERIAHRRYGTE